MPWALRDKARPLLRSGRGFVLNLDDSESGRHGTHWVAVRRMGSTLLYADPFGTELNGYPPIEIDIYPHRIVNSRCFQDPLSNTCGYYAYRFAKTMDGFEDVPTQKEMEHALDTNPVD
jgi:hypothetical protein